MNNNSLYREYRMKSYLNMNHYILIDGKSGEVHPHTWEFVFVILVPGDDFVEFRVFENVIDEYLNNYQNQVLNEIAPFDVINPTIENVVDHFADDIRIELEKFNGELVSLEGSETPTRSYIVSFKDDLNFAEDLGIMIDERVSEIIEEVVTEIKDGMED